MNHPEVKAPFLTSYSSLAGGNGLSRAHVPQKLSGTPSAGPVQFECASTGQLGVHMRNILQSSSYVKGANEPLIGRGPSSKIRVHILWPGYLLPDNGFEYEFRASCRGELAVGISNAFRAFFSQANKSYKAVKDSPFDVSKIPFERLLLASAVNVGGDVFHTTIMYEY